MGTGALTVTTPTAREIVLTRAFDAPRHLVFDAWTKPELLTRWFGARGWNLVVCEVDLRIGGAWRFVSRGPEGERMAQGGTYRVILRPDRLVYTELFDDTAVNETTRFVQLTPPGSGCLALTECCGSSCR